ncbi:MAG: D-alanyl-D-alanine carboxypeptidase family protein [Gammaproteobacteria bacterium]|nr:MAG: D-alanyl-D-alanine carboxypeptidase family protein [Gammaproteobacteria bacterium]
MLTQQLTQQQLTGKDPKGLISLPDSLACKKDQLAHPQAVNALLQLQSVAKKADQSFYVLSSYRSFEQQKSIWNRKYRGELKVVDGNEAMVDMDSLKSLERIHAIMLYSALPGASRHHWGCDFDIFPKAAMDSGYQPQLLQSEFNNGGPASSFNLWLTKALKATEFFRPYQTFQQGIAAEPWHISYRPIAEPALQQLTAARLAKELEAELDLAGKDTICDNMTTLYQRFISNIYTDTGIKGESL